MPRQVIMTDILVAYYFIVITDDILVIFSLRYYRK